MCGIAGEVRWEGVPGDSHVREIVHRLRHRGPDDFGIWSSPDTRCVLGHARLSIIDLSPAGHQPMVDPLTGNAIVFNGEIYNFQERRRECERRGDRFHSHSDTEVILALYRQFGTACLRYLRGMFAFALWDAREQTLFLARDRVGKKPLSYALTSTGIVFASEIDPLAAHPGLPGDLDQDALELYLQMQYIPAPWTIYRAIRKLPPAHCAVLGRGGLTITPYWDVDYRPKVAMSEPDALEGLEAKLAEAVRLRLIADVPVGALLSGGIDSSVVVALMAAVSPTPPKTFSIGFQEERLNELGYAQTVADRFRTDHHPEVIEGSIEELLPRIVRHYGEPFADSSAVPSFRVCQTARRHVTVVLNGDGGDELLGGYGRYAVPSWRILSGGMLGSASAPDTLARVVGTLGRPRSAWSRVQREWYLGLSNPELNAFSMSRPFWNDIERARLLGRATPEGMTVLPVWRTSILGRCAASADNPIDRMLWIDNHAYLPGDLLVKMDIASMYCGLEARSPLLDHEVIEYCASLPTSLKVRHRTGKYLLKRLAERYFPKEFVHRRKMGFAVPLAEWLRGRLRPMLQELLDDPDAMAPLDMGVIREHLAAFFERGAAHDSRLWALLMYGLWRRHARGGTPAGASGSRWVRAASARSTEATPGGGAPA
jgi:asparagine synthase (glutamine-hydrolysing)